MASVRKLPSGKYQARVSYRDGDKYKVKSFTAETKKEALRLAALFEPAKYTGTIGEMVEKYIELKKAVLSPSTLRSYLSVAKSIKTQHEAFWSLTEVSQADAQAVANSYSPKTAKNYLSMVSSAVKFAGKPFPQVSYPAWELRSDFIPDEDDVQRIVEDVAGTPMQIPVALGILGLRRSEIVGLSLSDLDGDVLHIHAAKVYGSDNKLHTKRTKTAVSNRFIILPRNLADLIRKNGSITELTSHAISGRFTRIIQRLGISMRFHDLRHYFASYCHNVLHLSDAQIGHLGGWAPNSSALRRHYIHSMHDKEAARLVAASVSKIMPKSVPK